MILETENLPYGLRGEIINVITIDMDPCITEQINLNQDGSYTIFLNARHSLCRQQTGFLHAAGHIICHDWDKSDVQAIETSAHKRKEKDI